MSHRLGVDVGGTFTDLMLFDEKSGRMALEKVPSTPANQAEGIVDGLQKICGQSDIEPAEIGFFIHGTTVATNAVLEGKGADTAVIVTKGFLDVLEIMRQDRPKLYDFFARRPAPLVPRSLRFEVSERILHTGDIQTPLDVRELRRITRKIKRSGARAVALCFLHSYVNPVHEQQAEAVLQEECPGVAVSVSSEILPEIKEYERMSTTTMNACVVPVVQRYLNELARQLEACGVNKTVHIMQSNGGIMPLATAGRKSIATILSGPAAGVLGGVALARQAGIRNAITVDMGGTSFDICLAHDGKVRFAHETEVGGHALKAPMIDIHAIGAGGGSVAWIDRGGALKVGPHSAGAVPGPVCYERGGTEPTVTDANLVLNRLSTDAFLGGDMQVNRDAARQAIETKLAKPLGLSAEEAAEGVIRIVNAGMVKGIRYVSVEKGYDPREFSMVSFGGNGPVHAVELAEDLGIPQVMVPFAPGVNCAYGLLAADFRQDDVRTYVSKLPDINLRVAAARYREMEAACRSRVRDEGVADDDIVITRSVDMRYHGQGYELEVLLGNGRLTREALKDTEKRFHALHKKQYGFSNHGDAVEIVNLRITCVGRLPKPALHKERLLKKIPADALKGARGVFQRTLSTDPHLQSRPLEAGQRY